VDTRYERGDSVARAYRKSQSPVLDRKPRRDRSYDRVVSELTPTLGARDRPPPLPLIGIAACIHPEPGYATPVPTQLIVGELDGTGDIRESMAAWAERERDAEYHVVGGAGHCANLDRPDEVNRLVLAFLERDLLPPLQTRGD
jgi:pimeloyl-ACP methyl ester carboxylesterase